MKRSRILCVSLAVSITLAAGVARAGDITFSDVQIAGSLVAGASYSTGNNTIDFFLPAAAVGDTLPARTGNILITYVAQSPVGMDQNRLLLSVLGALSGSGTIFFNEVIEDILDPANPVVIATHNALLDEFSDLPYAATLDFSHPSTRIKVKKSLTLAAPDTPAFDFAAVGLIEQTLRIIPEPLGLALLAGASVGMLPRRRR